MSFNFNIVIDDVGEFDMHVTSDSDSSYNYKYEQLSRRTVCRVMLFYTAGIDPKIIETLVRDDYLTFEYYYPYLMRGLLSDMGEELLFPMKTDTRLTHLTLPSAIVKDWLSRRTEMKQLSTDMQDFLKHKDTLLK